MYAIRSYYGFLEELAVTDPLTGLYNRRQLEKRLDEELSRSRRQRLGFSLLLIDLDNFKTYNDLCGHLAGDRALQKTASLLQASAREMDVVTRYGGEEFCVLLPGVDRAGAQATADRLLQAVRQLRGERLTVVQGDATSRLVLEEAGVASADSYNFV